MYVDKRLAGIHAVQTLSRLNRACAAKDTTYVVDFVNEADDVLAAFKTYYSTAQLAGTTDPNLVYNLRAKLDAAGHYDDFEVDRIVAAELKANGTQGDLLKALEPVADRLIKRYRSVQLELRSALERGHEAEVKTARDALDALILFKADMGAFLRLYIFLSQIFDYGNTALEKRAIFYKRLLPLLEFGREREGIDVSKLVLTHHKIKNLGKNPMRLNEGEAPTLEPVTEAGSGALRDAHKVRMREIIEQLNNLFGGDTTEQDQLMYVTQLKGKMLESATLRLQAANNAKEQFASSPDLDTELDNAIISALDAHTSLSTQALNSPAIRRGIKEILLNHVRLWEALREQKGLKKD
jgi:type I restriction enzyme R subunit